MTLDPRTLTPAQLDSARRIIGRREAVLKLKNADGVVYMHATENGRHVARAFAGRAIRPAWHYWFKTRAAMLAYITQWAKGLAEIAARKAQQLAERAAFRHTLKIGDVLYCSWGYEQTNIDYYQVTALHGTHEVSIREIASERESTGWEQGRSVPSVDQFVGDAMRKRVSSGNRVRITSYASAHPLPNTETNGVRVYQSQSWTSYA